MFTIPPSLTGNMSIEEVLTRLQAHDLVAGLVVAGSAGQDVLTPDSDFDIVVVLRDYPYPLHVILTTIDGRMADVVFWSVAQLDEMLSMDVVRGNSPQSAVFHWIKTGSIGYDETGKLSALRNHHPEFVLDDNLRDQFNLWYRINFNLYHGQGMLNSRDEVYLTAMDMRFLYMLLEVMDAYLMVRNIPQRGEKFTIRYLKSDALALYMSALQVTNRDERFAYYREFAQIALEPVGGIWGSQEITAFNLHSDMPPDNHHKLFEFWKDLLDYEQ